MTQTQLRYPVTNVALVGRLLFLGAATVLLSTASATAQHALSIPHPVPGWADMVNSAPPYTHISLGTGQFHTTVPLRIGAQGIVLEGAGARATEIIADARMDAVIESTSRIMSLRDLVIDANHQASFGIHAIKPTFPDTKTLEGIDVLNAVTDGIVLEACQICRIDGVSVSNSGRDGIVFAGCNACLATAVLAQQNGGRGIVVRADSINGETFSGGMTLIDTNAEANGAAQIDIVDTTSAVLIENPWIEGHDSDTDGILIESPHVSVVGGRISGRGHQGTAIHLKGAGKAANISGDVQMENESFGGNFARIAR